MSKKHDVIIKEGSWMDSAEYFSFEVAGESRKITAIARDSTGDLALIKVTAEQAREVVDALEAAIVDLETPQVGDTIDSAKVLEKLPHGSILRNPIVGTAYWRNGEGWFSPSTYTGRSAGEALSIAGGSLELLCIGEGK